MTLRARRYGPRSDFHLPRAKGCAPACPARGFFVDVDDVKPCLHPFPVRKIGIHLAVGLFRPSPSRQRRSAIFFHYNIEKPLCTERKKIFSPAQRKRRLHFSAAPDRARAGDKRILSLKRKRADTAVSALFLKTRTEPISCLFLLRSTRCSKQACRQ